MLVVHVRPDAEPDVAVTRRRTVPRAVEGTSTSTRTLRRPGSTLVGHDAWLGAGVVGAGVVGAGVVGAGVGVVGAGVGVVGAGVGVDEPLGAGFASS